MIALTRILIKLFAYGFYKLHSGLLLSLFVSVIIYFFFIEVLNKTHLPAEHILEHHLVLVLEFVSNPVMMGVIFSFWLIYTIKSWKYIAGQLRASEQQFLFYSSTALGKWQQFQSWFIMQLIVLLPLIAFGLFAFIIGILYDHYIIPTLILLYILLLNCISAFIYIVLVNRLTDTNAKNRLLTIIRKWPKPFFSLFLYHIFNTFKLTYSITKFISWLIISSLSLLFFDQQQDLRIVGIIILGFVTAHTILVYHSHEFEKNYLSFSRNFPYSRIRLFIHMAGLYFLLLLPESIWLVYKFGYSVGTGLVLFGLGITLLFRSILYWFTLAMNNYLRVVFTFFIICFLLILHGLLWPLIPLILLISLIAFFQNYYFSNL